MTCERRGDGCHAGLPFGVTPCLFSVKVAASHHADLAITQHRQMSSPITGKTPPEAPPRSHPRPRTSQGSPLDLCRATNQPQFDRSRTQMSGRGSQVEVR